MASLPYFPFYPSDWLSSPRIMCSTLVQQGVYIRLLSVCWLSGDCSLPDDPRKLSMLSGLPEQELEFVYQMFTPHPRKDGHLTNDRLLKEWEKANWISKKRSQAGKKSGKVRRTHVQHMPKHNANKKGTCVDKSESESESDSELDSEERKKKEEKKELNASSAVKPRGVSKSGAVWEAYRAAYLERYKVEPVRDRQANVALCQVVEKLGQEEAPKVAAFYLTHNDPFYVRKSHPPNLLALNATGLRTEWASGRRVTTSAVRHAEFKDNVIGKIERVQRILNERGTA